MQQPGTAADEARTGPRLHPSKDPGHFRTAPRRRIRDWPSKDPADYAAREKKLGPWLDRHIFPSRDPDDYARREKTMGWMVSGPLRPSIWFWLFYLAGVGTSIARAYVDEPVALDVLLYATVACFTLSAFVLIFGHRRQWRRTQGLPDA